MRTRTKVAAVAKAPKAIMQFTIISNDILDIKLITQQ